MSFFFLKKILSNSKVFSIIILSVIFLYFNQSFINQGIFYFSFFVYGATFLLLRKFFLALLVYELKNKNLNIRFKKIKNILLINSSIFLFLPGAKIFFANDRSSLFLFFFISLIAYLVLIYFSIKKTRVHNNSGRIVLWFVSNLFFISFSSWLVFIFFLSLLKSYLF